MRIYDFRGFANPARIRITVAEKRLSDLIEFVTVDVPGGEHRQPPFLAKNPSGTIPVLELDDGTMIAECTAITEYLDNVDGEAVLTGSDGKERAIIHMMQRRAESRLLDPVAAYFHHATPGLGPQIETYQNREWGEKNREVALEGMRYFDGLLRNQDYLAGDRFSMADITAFAGLLFADISKIDVPADLTGLRAWRTKVAERPSVMHA
ncbi:glutathione S-transferase [Sphingomonas alba]|uniref:Glutathione S-transferase n=1 Tax=Sphingomonas alba TaxID=2908208 RepID=A0ABT0RKR4_9SPHN|nr:glutathione S-transferase [Sphingomonas alba]MCL6683216.1 glutathione S-transferase [Sphingomonas alba]